MITSREELSARVSSVRSNIEAACAGAGRDPSDVTLVAVSKLIPARLVRWARDLGIIDFGENYVKEMTEKRKQVTGARWHFLGTLQSHTVNAVAGNADMVHSLEPGGAVERLSRKAASEGLSISGLVQVDLAGRPTGTPPGEVRPFLERAEGLEGLAVTGLMTIPPASADLEDARGYFRTLREMRDELRGRWPRVVELSMGMSLDYEVAVGEGATIVRVGTAIFGEREAPGGK